MTVRFPQAAITADDHELISAASAVLKEHYRPFWHMVAAAIRSEDGRVWTGVHIGTTVGRLSVCAEAVAFGRAILTGDKTVHTVVAVRHPKPHEDDQEIAIVPPCGACREMLLDHAPASLIIINHQNSLIKLPVQTLLPYPYRR